MLQSVKSKLSLLLLFQIVFMSAQEMANKDLLDIDRIYSGEFQQDYERKIQWIENGNAYVIIEKSDDLQGADELVRYDSKKQTKSVYVPATGLQPDSTSLSIESFSLSPDGTKVLIFTNSSRVWRSNTKGDYWLFDRETNALKQLGASLEASSLMFAKISSDNADVFYVHKFNVYKENLSSGKIDQLTTDGDGDIINGTFDWVYEEEFGKRDGFNLSNKDSYLAFWHLDASDTGVFYMINNTDSIYSQPIPVQYPKVGEPPSAAKIGVIDLKSKKTKWITLPGGERENYIPGMQWVSDDLLMIQQMNRHQNTLIVWSYIPSNGELKKIYTEKEDTYIELNHPDLSADSWGSNDLPVIDDGKAFLRLNENDAWRHIYKVDIESGGKTLITPFDYDIASMRVPAEKNVYYMASPENGAQRYLYQTDLRGKGNQKKLTPEGFQGVNNYNVSPNGAFAIHIHQSANKVRTVRFISLPDHRVIKTLVDNEDYKKQLAGLSLPEVIFKTVTTEEGIDIDAKITLPVNFDKNKKYPVLFYVYGEPWGQVATDTYTDLWYIMMAQKGYVVVAMDNRGTPSLNGSKWRKSIYRQVGRINVKDQAMAAKEILKLEYIDPERTAVWGWSGGGTMTLNLMFKYPEIYKTGVAVAAVSNQLVYDNIYQERYMGLPQENMQDFVDGSPVTYAKGLEGNLLLIHGTADDNVHYQSAEILINELIKENKKFQMMAYPNRSHGIYEGDNTRKHLYTLITDYILEHTPPNSAE